MRFAVQENLVSGGSLAEKAQHLAEWGYEGVELRGERLAERTAEIRTALADSGVKAAAICGGYKFGLLFPEPAEREQSRNEIRRLLELAPEVGSCGVIVVPIFGPPRLPDMSPWRTAAQAEEELLVEQLADLAEFAGRHRTQVILEPLNRYETHYLRRLDQAAAICRRVASPHMTILADFFHMNIEEARIGEAIRTAGARTGYVHLADSNRVVPGGGHIDFREGFAALRAIDYRGWMSLECHVPGDAASSLRETLAFMRAQM